jgi:hypothetical protein
MTDTTWNQLGSVAPEALVDARLVAHWAAQIVAAASVRIAARADFSHTSLRWSAEHGALLTNPIDGAYAGLRLRDLTLLVVGDGEVDKKSLVGSTLQDGLQWLQATLNQRLGSAVELALLVHDMPPHPVGDGASFPNAIGDAYAELDSWFSNGSQLVSEVAAARGGSEARCWPHHFDLATLITVVSHEDPEEARTVGIGLSPGDGGYAEPYWYVTPWPRPATDALGELSAGRWHTEGWTGAVLSATELVAADDQLSYVRMFVRDAADAATKLVSPS